MAHNPWIGERQPFAWGAILGILNTAEWPSHGELRAAAVANKVTAKTADNLLLTAQKYGIVARRGTYSSKLKRDFREYWRLPAEAMNEAQRVWVEVPAKYACPCGARSIGRFTSKKTGRWTWMCADHAALHSGGPAREEIS